MDSRGSAASQRAHLRARPYRGGPHSSVSRAADLYGRTSPAPMAALPKLRPLGPAVQGFVDRDGRPATLGPLLGREIAWRPQQEEGSFADKTAQTSLSRRMDLLLQEREQQAAGLHAELKGNTARQWDQYVQDSHRMLLGVNSSGYKQEMPNPAAAGGHESIAKNNRALHQRWEMLTLQLGEPSRLRKAMIKGTRGSGMNLHSRPEEGLHALHDTMCEAKKEQLAAFERTMASLQASSMQNERLCEELAFGRETQAPGDGREHVEAEWKGAPFEHANMSLAWLTDALHSAQKVNQRLMSFAAHEMVRSKSGRRANQHGAASSSSSQAGCGTSDNSLAPAEYWSIREIPGEGSATSAGGVAGEAACGHTLASTSGTGGDQYAELRGHLPSMADDDADDEGYKEAYNALKQAELKEAEDEYQDEFEAGDDQTGSPRRPNAFELAFGGASTDDVDAKAGVVAVEEKGAAAGGAIVGRQQTGKSMESNENARKRECQETGCTSKRNTRRSPARAGGGRDRSRPPVSTPSLAVPLTGLH